MEGMIGEIRMFAGNFAPKNWSFCNGSIIAIASNTALFSILGTTYGGNGTTTFALPDLQGRFPVGIGQGPGLGNISEGEKSGTETQTMTLQNLPAHTHMAMFKTNNGNASQISPAAGYPAMPTARVAAPGYSVQASLYGTSQDATMAADFVTLGPNGGNQPFGIMNPYTGMNYVICMYGIFPSRG